MTAQRQAKNRPAPRRLLTLAAASVVVIGATSAAVAAPSPRDPVAVGTGSAAVAATDAERLRVASGDIDGDALRKQLMHERRAGSSANQRSSRDATRVTEQSSPRLPGNDQIGGAQPLPRPHARTGLEVQLNGTLSTTPLRPASIEPNEEDDGSIPLARELDLQGDQARVTTTGRIGDGPHGSQGTNHGDYDFYELRAAAGDALTVDIEPQDGLTPQAYLYNSDGDLLIGAQDMTGAGDVHLYHPIEQAGTYYVAIGTWRPGNPFDSASGPIALSEGPYELDLSLRSSSMDDTDMFTVRLKEGDVLGATVKGSPRRIAIHSLDGNLVQASQVDLGVVYADRSPLPRGGNATTDHVVGKSGLYSVAISDGSGPYSATIVAQRPPERPRQTILLDFSGPSFDNRVFPEGLAVEPGVREVSPMRAFLPRWGLQTSDELAVISATTKLVERILRTDIPGSKVQVVNSVTHPHLFGKPGVSRVIVGGTVEEAGMIPALGLAQSVDPGNFAREETAIVMLDRVSSDTDGISLNLRMTPESDRVRAVSQTLGYTAAHEIGHFLGNYHTDDYDDYFSVMNTGYKLNILAVGPDGVSGTADDDVLAMRRSHYDLFQGLTGIEDTATRTRVALH